MDLPYLNQLRRREMLGVIARYGPLLAGKRVLEIGSGTGVQLDELSLAGSQVIGVDLPEGMYAAAAHPRIVKYDGRRLPFPDQSFDVVFSSNVLEHIAHWAAFQQEIARVLVPAGHCIHVVPSHHWKFWTTIVTGALAPFRIAKALWRSLRSRKWYLPSAGVHWLDLLVGERHGEFGTRLTEYLHFQPRSWRRSFLDAGWEVLEIRPNELAYEGNMVFGNRISLQLRSRLSHVLGSACYVFLLARR